MKQFKCDKLFLLDIENSCFCELDDEIKQELFEDNWKLYVEKYKDKLMAGDIWLYMAKFNIHLGRFVATERVTYEKWMLKDKEDRDYPFYYDCAEGNERVMFDHIIYGNMIKTYGGVVKREAITPRRVSLNEIGVA